MNYAKDPDTFKGSEELRRRVSLKDPKDLPKPTTSPFPPGMLGSLEPQEETVENPKEAAGRLKDPTWSVLPRWVNLMVGRVMSIGAAKYGAFNYRESSVKASTYEDALERHLSAWFAGEDNDPETGVSHLASGIAGLTILLDAQMHGKLEDDRRKSLAVQKMLEQLKVIKETHPMPKPAASKPH